MKRPYKHYNTIISFAFLATISCNKIVEVSPPVNKPSSSSIYASNVSAASVLTGIYSRMIQNSSGFASGFNSISAMSGLSSDELVNYTPSDPSLSQFYTNSLSSQNIIFWSELYTYIYSANAAIEGLSNSNSISGPVKQQLLGEAKFIRAYCHFYLVTLFGDIPIVTTTDYRTNSLAGRNSKDDVFKQIITDLKEAKDLLSTDFLKSDIQGVTPDRIRPTKWAAIALLARCYLYTSDWKSAEEQATIIIDNKPQFGLTSLNNAFLKNSSEAIWQLQPVRAGYNTYDGYYFILNGIPSSASPFAASSFLVNSFEPGDARRAAWLKDTVISGSTYTYPFKYKVQGGPANTPVTEYLMVLRLAEQYLIRAEARAQQNSLTGSLSDVNTIRTRAGLTNLNVNDKNTLLTLILHERQTELFTEWGHRWLDLKRTGQVDATMSIVTPKKGGVWNTNWKLYPIPLSEILIDKNLVQNPGY